MIENEKKYGSKGNDIIEIQHKMGFKPFTGFIFGNVQKYLHRYLSVSSKAKNDKDIEKVLDYISRFEEKYDYKDLDGHGLCYRLKNLIINKEYKTAFINAVDIQEYLMLCIKQD